MCYVCNQNFHDSILNNINPTTIRQFLLAVAVKGSKSISVAFILNICNQGNNMLASLERLSTKKKNYRGKKKKLKKYYI